MAARWGTMIATIIKSGVVTERMNRLPPDMHGAAGRKL
jgi:hypothetical protein